MATRMRSPSYPSTSLPQAIELIEKLFKIERTNPIDREVAAQGLGYSGLTGQSAKVLSNLIQYGLLEKAGKSEVRVTSRAVEIILPDSDDEKRAALMEAIEEPDLFRQIQDRFPDGLPSNSALRAYLLKNGFTDAAIPPAARTYLESYQYIQDANVSDGHGAEADPLLESVQSQRVATEKSMKHERIPSTNIATPSEQSDVLPKMPVGIQEDGIRVNTLIKSADDAKRIMGLIDALVPFIEGKPQNTADRYVAGSEEFDDVEDII